MVVTKAQKMEFLWVDWLELLLVYYLVQQKARLMELMWVEMKVLRWVRPMGLL